MKTLKILSMFILALCLIGSVSAIVYGTFDDSISARNDYISEVIDPETGYIIGVTINEGVSVDFEVVFVFPLETLSVTLYGPSLPSEGVILFPTIEESSYNNYTVSNSLKAGSYEIVILGSDTIGTDSSYLTLTIKSVEEPNNPPVLDYIEPQSTNENELLEFTISATDADDDSLTFPQPTNLPTGASLTDNTDGTATFSWTPNYTQSGTYDITFTVSDGTDTDSETITITVNDVTVGNTAPTITTTAITQVYENQAYTYDVDATDADGDTLTYSLTQNPLEFSIDSTTGAITGTAPEVNQDTDYTVTVQVSDGNGGTDTQTYTLTVNNYCDKDKKKKTTTNYYQSNYEEQLYLDQFKPSKIIYLEDDQPGDKDLNFWQRFIEWLKNLFGFN